MTTSVSELRERLGVLRQSSSPRDARGVESLFAALLVPLLEREGYKAEVTDGAGDRGVDLDAVRAASDGRQETLGIQFKYYRQPVGADAVRALVGAAVIAPYDRVLLIGKPGFTVEAVHLARRVEPVAIELLGLDDLGGWIDRLESQPNEIGAQAALIIRGMAHEYAKLVAREPMALDHIHWRNLEYMLERVMEGLGFKVTLMPGSKDGGKDLVLEAEVSDGQRRFAVQVKHWPSGQRVGSGAVRHFLNVIVREGHAGGLFLSTSGYTKTAFEGLVQMDRERLRFGTAEKVVALARTYMRVETGLWTPSDNLADVLFDDTV